MRKVLLFVLLLLTVSIGIAASTDPAARSEPVGYELFLNGTSAGESSALRMSDDTLMIAVRQVASIIGVQLSWDPGTKSMSAVKGGSRLDMTVGKSTAFRNGAGLPLTSAPFIHHDEMYVPLRAFCESFDSIVRWDDTGNKVTIIPGSELLPQVGDFKQLKSLLAEFMKENRSTRDRLSMAAAMADSVPQAAATADNMLKAETTDYSTTNVQVKGVDEGDLVKSDGEYIYQVNGSRIAVILAYPAEQMKLISMIPAEAGFQPSELYLDQHQLTVVGTTVPMGKTDRSPYLGKMPAPAASTVKAVVYDISIKTSIKKVREFQQSGQYVTSRKIGTNLYLVSNQYVDLYRLQKDDDTVLPFYNDSAAGSVGKPVRLDEIRYFPDHVQPNFLVVGVLDTTHSETVPMVKAFVGEGRNVYASSGNLYVTMSQSGNSIRNAKMERIGNLEAESQTSVYKFTLDGTNIRLSGKGDVPGTVLNQFSMDEAAPYFRIATTTGSIFRTDEYTSRNNVYVLDESMAIIGKLENLAPGEKIYSVRFMGGRGYMVTFKKVDPLFVLDLSNPRSPAVLGKLKIPGYSDYLHPYDETHLIGFGKDAVDASTEGKEGSPDFAYYQGMKMALFDVSDVTHPVEISKETIGDRGTDSELLRNHRALLFSRERGLVAFPVTVMEKTEAQKRAGNAAAYGQFAFQGVYVYKISLTQGFQLQAKISHLSETDLLKAGTRSSYGDPHYVDRAVYIGDSLYTLSRNEVRATDLRTFMTQNQLAIPE